MSLTKKWVQLVVGVEAAMVLVGFLAFLLFVP